MIQVSCAETDATLAVITINMTRKEGDGVVHSRDVVSVCMQGSEIGSDGVSQSVSQWSIKDIANLLPINNNNSQQVTTFPMPTVTIAEKLHRREEILCLHDQKLV